MSNGKTTASASRSHIAWKAFLFLPWLGLCFPQMYARATPVLLGFPFFYWYQLVWVLLASAIMGVAYRKLRKP